MTTPGEHHTTSAAATAEPPAGSAVEVAAAAGQGTLELDEQSLAPEDLSLNALYSELNQQKRPPAILCKFMNVLENKRMKRKLGWSRPWNKYGLNVFRTHKLSAAGDRQYIDGVRQTFQRLLEDAPSHYISFAESLFDDRSLMGFIFHHNNQGDDCQYEGITISLGRKVADDRTKRDRLDLVLEDRRVNGAVDGKIDRVRVYANPYDNFAADEHYLLEVIDPEGSQAETAQSAYDDAVTKYHKWKEIPERQWSHWSTRYIEYFGKRSFIPIGSSFV